jgi:hypothetical protein
VVVRDKCPDLTTFILARKSQLAGDMGDGVTAVDLAQAAAAQARPETRLGAIAATNAAYGFALMADRTNVDRALDRAHDLLSSRDVDPSFSCRKSDRRHQATAPGLPRR